MRSFILTAALAGSGFFLTAEHASAQVIYRSYYGPGIRTVPRYAPVPSYYSPPAFPQAGFPQVSDPTVDYIRNLYVNTLGREPDPQGMETWLIRYQQLGGDVERLTAEFNAAANLELNANNPAYRFAPLPRYRRYR